jgi:hypothetical protein
MVPPSQYFACTPQFWPRHDGDQTDADVFSRDPLAQLEAALKIAKPIQFKENIALVLKYFDQLVPFMQELDTNLRPAD